MNVAAMSNFDLLSVVIGNTRAKAMAGKSLSELFGFTKSRQGCLGEELATYSVAPELVAARELVARGIEEAWSEEAISLSSPRSVKAYLTQKLGNLEHEEFWCMWLNSQNRLIVAESMFRGTLTQTSVYPREVAKRALALNAAALIMVHNHPSGCPEPSTADKMLTSNLKTALALVDVQVLDHFVVAGTQAISFGELGLL